MPDPITLLALLFAALFAAGGTIEPDLTEDEAEAEAEVIDVNINVNVTVTDNTDDDDCADDDDRYDWYDYISL